MVDYRDVPASELARQQPLVRTKVQRWAKVQAQSGRSFQQPVGDVCGVLQMRHQNALLDPDTVFCEVPDGLAVLNGKFFEGAFRGKGDITTSVLVAAETPAKVCR